MKDEFVKYVINLYQNVPWYVYEMLLFVFCIGLILMITFCGIKRGLRKSLGLILMEYAFLLFSSTVLFREVNEKQGFELHPFWCYGREELIIQNVMNVAVFVPIGILLGFVIQGARFSRLASPNERQGRSTVRHGWLIALAMGFCISGSIEAMQYFFQRGFAEMDDVMHNTIGCVLGYILVKGSLFMVKSFK